jgi:uncharacterized membrane protein YebE (DUF533 family)
MSDHSHDSQSPFTRDEMLLFARAVANIVGADHKVSGEERTHLFDVLREMGLSPYDEQVQKVVDDELNSPSPIDKIVKSVTSPVLRRNLYRTLVEVALTDGLANEEEKRLAELAKTFELNEKAARELIQWTLDSLALDKREDDILKRL